MKVIGYIPLYYGAEYLDACIKSMAPHVEKIIVIYVDKPSQGYDSGIPCPEGEEMLKEIAVNASEKVEWHKGRFGHEAQHREYILQHSEGYDLVLTCDADEVITDDIQGALEQAYNSKNRRFNVSGFVNFWRSFDYACYDGFLPARITNLHNTEGEETVHATYYHFSCAQSEEIVRFKWNVSGHKSELRPNYLDEVFYGWTKENQIQDLHPVAFGLWNATPFDKTTLPDVLKNHPNYNKEVI